MHYSTTPSLSQNIWPRWASRQFFSLPIVKTLLPVTFGYSLSSRKNCRYETIEEMKDAVTKVIGTLKVEDFHGAFQKLLERYNKCIAAGGDYIKGDLNFKCILSINVPIRKKSRNLIESVTNPLRTICLSLLYQFSVMNLIQTVLLVLDKRLIQ